MRLGVMGGLAPRVLRRLLPCWMRRSRSKAWPK